MKESSSVAFPFVITVLFLWLVSGFLSLRAQSVSFMPFYGYKNVKMESVNQRYQNSLSSLATQTENVFPGPELFDGNQFWGLHVNYRLEGGYFLYAGSYYYFEKIKLNHTSGSVALRTNREIELLDINLGIKYFPGYNSWRRLNFYGAVNVGYAIGWARSELRYDDGTNSVNNRGDFTAGTLTTAFAAGINLRLTTMVSLNGEAGYHLCNPGKMEGRLNVSQVFPKNPLLQNETVDDNFITDEEFNFSGFYAHFGLQFNIFSL